MMRRSTSFENFEERGSGAGAADLSGKRRQKFRELEADAADDFTGANGLGEQVGVHGFLRGEDDRAFDYVFEFADVAWPIVIHQKLHGGVSEDARRLAVVAAKLFEEAADQERDVFLALAQRRKMERNYVEAMEEIFAEAAFAHELGEIFVGGGEDADVYFYGVGATEAHEFAFLDDAEELGLGFRADRGDFVEENRALIGDFEEAFFGSDRAGECAFHVAEELRFEQVHGDGAGVDGDEGFVGARGGGVNGFRDDFFSGAAFAGD